MITMWWSNKFGLKKWESTIQNRICKRANNIPLIDGESCFCHARWDLQTWRSPGSLKVSSSANNQGPTSPTQLHTDWHRFQGTQLRDTSSLFSQMLISNNTIHVGTLSRDVHQNSKEYAETWDLAGFGNKNHCKLICVHIHYLKKQRVICMYLYI